MRCSFFSRRAVSACAAMFLVFTAAALEAAPAKVRTAKRSPAVASAKAEHEEAATLLRQALAAEAAGKGESRVDRLAKVIERFPDYAPARWHAGQVRLADRWMSFDQAAYERGKHSANEEYHRLRSATPPTASAQQQLAIWCAKTGLAEQERAHRLLAVSLGSSTPENLVQLGLQYYRGTWLTKAQLERQQAESDAARRAAGKWHGKLLTLRKAIEGGSTESAETALAELRRLGDPAIVPLLERLYSPRSEKTALAAVSTLQSIPGQEAISSLARHAVFARWPEVRRQAAQGLRDCSLYTYAPLLLSGLTTPIEAQFEAGDLGPGMWQCRLAFYREGLAADVAHVASQSVILQLGRTGISALQMQQAQGTADASLAQAAETLEQVKAYNNGIAEVNGRIGEALGAATGEDRPAKARSWWDWWYDHNEMYYTSQRPVYQTASTQSAVFSPPRASECFAAGTQVWTLTGPLDIERIQPGDSVLAQDVVSGELAYQPVLAITTRPPCGVLKIRSGRDTLTATRGHPFWVSGAGWRMAKELQEGDLLHTVTGTVAIESIEQVPDEAAYNLVVDDFSSYFVGAEKILVHDNELRMPTDNPVPGLVPQP